MVTKPHLLRLTGVTCSTPSSHCTGMMADRSRPFASPASQLSNKEKACVNLLLSLGTQGGRAPGKHAVWTRPILALAKSDPALRCSGADLTDRLCPRFSTEMALPIVSRSLALAGFKWISKSQSPSRLFNERLALSRTPFPSWLCCVA